LWLFIVWIHIQESRISPLLADHQSHHVSMSASTSSSWQSVCLVGGASNALVVIKFLISTCFASFIFCFSSESRDRSLTSIALLRSCDVKNDSKFSLLCFNPRFVSGIPMDTSTAAVSCVQNDCAYYSSWKSPGTSSHGPLDSPNIPRPIPSLELDAAPEAGGHSGTIFFPRILLKGLMVSSSIPLSYSVSLGTSSVTSSCCITPMSSNKQTRKSPRQIWV